LVSLKAKEDIRTNLSDMASQKKSLLSEAALFAAAPLTPFLVMQPTPVKAVVTNYYQYAGSYTSSCYPRPVVK
jgi:hypothetical protein